MNTPIGVVVKVDGIDGCGKSTLVQRLFRAYNGPIRVECTREFGSDNDEQVLVGGRNGTVARVLYEFALAPRFAFDQIERQVAMALAARRQNRMGLPKLRNQNDLVISDRSSLSSYAYGHDIGDEFELFLDWAVGSVLQEDYVLWIDLDPTTAFNRSRTDSGFLTGNVTKDLVEMRGVDYQIAVQERFAELSRARRNVIRLDGRLNEDELLASAIIHVDKILAGCFDPRSVG